MDDRIIVYQKPTCSTCRELDRILRESGTQYDKVNYYIEPIMKDKLVQLLKKLHMSPRQLLRSKESIYRELGLDKLSHSDEAIVDLMVQYPDLIQRPIVERGDRAVLARPAENVRELL